MTITEGERAAGRRYDRESGRNKRWSKAIQPGRERRSLGRPGTADERFMVKVLVEADGCWSWLGSLNGKGYGLFTDERGACVRAHRWAYARFVGEIPEGLGLDHLCENKACVNPGHLEPVTAAENIRRARAGA